MCCIFTCCGWMIDLLQRLWTFTMSCCISSAVCCSLLTASMSGIALGYNYSLAEYIDLKETNVSVYLKRGVFDDDIADDMEWRRSGHLPISGHIKEDNLMTASNIDESTTLRSGRRLDDSIYESNERYNFEGSLMKLTAKPPADASSTASSFEPLPLHEIVQKFPSNSLDQLKAVQSVINMRKMAAAATRTTRKEISQTPFVDVRNNPNFDVAGVEGSNRRAMNYDVPPYLKTSTFDSLRKAVPDDAINNPMLWMLPKLQPKTVNDIPQHSILPPLKDYYEHFTYPSPVTRRAGPLRPTRPKPMRPSPTKTTSPTLTTRNQDVNFPKSIDEEMDSFKSKYMVDRVDVPSSKEDFMKKVKTGPKPNDEDYEEEIKGVPLRKKRNSGNLKVVNKNLQTNTKPSIDKLNKDKERDLVKDIKTNKHDLSDSAPTTTLRLKTEPFDKLKNTILTKKLQLLKVKGDFPLDVKTTTNDFIDKTIASVLKLAITPSNKLDCRSSNIDLDGKTIERLHRKTSTMSNGLMTSQTLIKLLLSTTNS